MTIAQLVELIEHVQSHHTIMADNRHGKHVKYIDPHIDMRTNDVFSVQFRGYGWTHSIHIVNECRDLPESLFDRCMAFLDADWPNDRDSEHAV